MEHCEVIEETKSMPKQKEGLRKGIFSVLMKLGVVAVLCAANCTVSAQTVDEIQKKINTKSARDTIHISNTTYQLWYIVRKDSTSVPGTKCAMLMSYTFLESGNPFNFNTAQNQPNYSGSYLQTRLRSDFLDLPTQIKDMAVNADISNTAKTAISKPTPTKGSNSNDALFAPSYQELYEFNNNSTSISGPPLKVYGSYAYAGRFWTRTASGTQVWEIYAKGTTFVEVPSNSTDVSMVGAVWVKYGVVNHTVSGTVTGLDNNVGVEVCYKIGGGTQKCTTTIAGGVYKITDVPYGSNVEIIPSIQPNHSVAVQFSPNPILNVTSDLTGKDIKYCPTATITGATQICIGTTTTLYPVSGGTWTSSDTNVAKVTNAGVVTGTGAGSAVFTFTGTGQIASCSSATATLTVNPYTVPSILISSNFQSPIIQGTSVTFSSTIANGGNAPAYQWKKNGVDVGSDSTYTCIPSDSDEFVCILTSNQVCANPKTDTSNIITITVKYLISGTVFPFVHDTTQNGESDTTFNKRFAITAKLYAAPDPDSTNSPIEDILNTEPLFETVVEYYDGSLWYQGIPKYPGEIARANNPGVPIHWAEVVQPSLIPSANDAELIKEELPQSPIGIFTIKNISEGNYILALSRAGYVTRFSEISIPLQSGFIGHRELIAGDVNENFMVGNGDVSDVKANLSSVPLPTRNTPDPKYDINADGKIDETDMLLVWKMLGFNLYHYSDTRIWILKYEQKIN